MIGCRLFSGSFRRWLLGRSFRSGFSGSFWRRCGLLGCGLLGWSLSGLNCRRLSGHLRRWLLGWSLSGFLCGRFRRWLLGWSLSGFFCGRFRRRLLGWSFSWLLCRRFRRWLLSWRSYLFLRLPRGARLGRLVGFALRLGEHKIATYMVTGLNPWRGS